MLLINKKQVDVKDISNILGVEIPLKKILKKPLFEINPALIYKDPANGSAARKHRQAMEFPAVFNAVKSDGTTVEIRYCTNRTPDPKTMGNSEKFAPRMVEFEGKAEYIANDPDKALYFWLHFFCKTSPFKKEGVPFDYELVDDEAKANEIIESLTLRSKATAHAVALAGDQLLIIAKGMKIPGASTMDELSIRANLMQFASDKPAEYLNLAESQVNQVHGLIIDAVDKGIFVLENVFNAKRWKWGKGAKKGELITEFSSKVQDDNEALIQYISQTAGVINEVLPLLLATFKAEKGKTNLESALLNVDILSELDGGKKEPEPDQGKGGGGGEGGTGGEDDLEELPKNFAESQDYIGNKIGKRTPALAKLLNDGINNGTITKENISMYMEQYKTQ